jgi:hypothetical protein
MYMNKRFNLIGILLLIAMVLSACGISSVENLVKTDKPLGENLPPVAAIKAQEALSAELGIDLVDVEIVSQEQRTWLDSCLGLGGVAESCLRNDVPGWLVEMSVNEKIYKVRTDWLGEQVRIEP